MNMAIGENIKALRQRKGVTQEQLAEAFGISAAAVSKWERGETLPDITLLPKLAFFFRVSIDELMGYHEGQVEAEIQRIIKEHNKEAENYHQKKCLEISTAAYKAYPNDFRIMELYMWDLVGGYADNDPAKIVKKDIHSLISGFATDFEAKLKCNGAGEEYIARIHKFV